MRRLKIEFDIEKEIDAAARYFLADALLHGRKPISRLYTVLDHGGGWRFVITPSWDIACHVGDGERAIEVPRVRIADPIQLWDMERTVRLAEMYAAQWMIENNVNDLRVLEATGYL